MRPLALSVVVCTKDRAADLARFLESLAAQERLPEELIVVDAGGMPVDEQVQRFAARVPAVACRHLRTEPGLPRQRNLGIAAAAGDVIAFFDDDVVLEPGYLGAVLAVFARDAAGEVGGVGGAQVPDPTPREPRVRRTVARLFGLETYGRGVVKRSGRPDYLFSPATETDVELLSGCNMTFRREVLETHRFDERLAGYALGEDLQLSYRVSRRWRLVLTPDARLAHRHTGGGRPQPDAYQRMAIFNRYLFFREHVRRRPADWLAWGWATLGHTLLVARHPRERGLRGALAGLAAVLRHARASS
jgi:GT2 family glycosyltransferase